MLYVPLLEGEKSEVITLTLRRILLHQNTTQQRYNNNSNNNNNIRNKKFSSSKLFSDGKKEEKLFSLPRVSDSCLNVNFNDWIWQSLITFKRFIVYTRRYLGN